MGFITFSVFFLFFFSAYCELDPNLVSIIYSHNSNYLVRGNMPIKQNNFQAQQLKQVLKGVTGLNQFNLEVVSFFNFLTSKQTRNRYIEEKFFENNSDYGELSFEFIIGSFISPQQVPQFLINGISNLYEFLSLDDLDALTTDLMDRLEKRVNPTIVYIHCSRGIDRTGLVGGAFKMKYLNQTFSEVHKENIEILGKSTIKRNHIHFNCENGLRWFCMYLGKKTEQCSI